MSSSNDIGYQLDRSRMMRLAAIRVYLVVIAAGNLVWEILQLPLYSLWHTGTTREIAFAVLHCTGGDILIASSCLIGALVLAGASNWPAVGQLRVASLAILFGIAYTVFSEWLNVQVRASWSYSPTMPLLRIGSLTVGLAPLLQWIMIPTVAFWMVHRDRLKRLPR